MIKRKANNISRSIIQLKKFLVDKLVRLFICHSIDFCVILKQL